jgi:hypothetical protein
MAVKGAISQWTQRFTIGSALSMIGLQFAFLFDATFRIVVIIGLFGAGLPMVFGMAYLLLPSYLGRTLSTQRLPGVHLIITYAGVGLLLGHELLSLGTSFLVGGILLWSAGVAVFIGILLHSAFSELIINPGLVRLSNIRSQRSTKFTLLSIPLALGYLVIGTIALLSTVDGFPDPVNATFPMIVHFYGTGFVTLLIFALGIRLLTGFFHVTPPKSLSWLILFCGSVAPGILAFNFYQPPWFTVGAILESIAITAYASLVVFVAYRTDRHRIGLYGIGFGALGGITAIGIVLINIIDSTSNVSIAAHVIVILNGFIILTIIGYAYQFFPVTNRQFWGATERGGSSTIFIIGAGTLLQTLSMLGEVHYLQGYGIALAVIGTSGYSYLMVRRLLQLTRSDKKGYSSG